MSSRVFVASALVFTLASATARAQTARDTAPGAEVAAQTSSDRLTHEVLATGLGSLAVASAAVGAGYRLREWSVATRGDGVANPLPVIAFAGFVPLTLGAWLVGVPLLTDWAGGHKGSVWAALGGGLLGTVVGGNAGAAIALAGKGLGADANSAEVIVPAAVVGWAIHTTSTVFFYELSVDDEPVRAADTAAAPALVPVLAHGYQGLVLTGRF